MATICLSWKDLNLNEDGFNIYRSETPMDVQNMPTPLATVSANIGSYDDTTGINGKLYYYRIGVIRGTDEAISGEIARVFGDTSNTHDLFGDSSILATYQFDSNGDDLGNNLSLTASSGVQYDTGIIGHAYRPLSGEYLRSDSSSFNLGTSSWTFSMWVKLNSYDDISPDNINGRLFSKALYGNSSTRYSLGVTPTGQFQLLLDDGTLGGNTFTPDNSISLNVWSHVTFIIERDVNSRLYINGEMISNQLSTLPSTINRTSSYQFGVGSYNNSSGIILGDAGVLDGLIDQFRIFNRVLNDTEIQILYQEGLR